MSIAMESKLEQDELRDAQLASVREPALRDGASIHVAALQDIRARLFRIQEVFATNYDIRNTHSCHESRAIADHWMEHMFGVDAILSMPLDFSAIVAQYGDLVADEMAIVAEQVRKQLTGSMIAHSGVNQC